MLPAGWVTKKESLVFKYMRCHTTVERWYTEQLPESTLRYINASLYFDPTVPSAKLAVELYIASWEQT